MSLGWMAWTWPTAVFFICVGLGLVLLTWLERRYPSRPRRGWLPLITSRGDRVFIALLSAAFVHIAWLAFSDLPVLGASALAVVLAAGLMRWG